MIPHMGELVKKGNGKKGGEKRKMTCVLFFPLKCHPINGQYLQGRGNGAEKMQLLPHRLWHYHHPPHHHRHHQHHLLQLMRRPPLSSREQSGILHSLIFILNCKIFYYLSYKHILIFYLTFLHFMKIWFALVTYQKERRSPFLLFSDKTFYI